MPPMINTMTWLLPGIGAVSAVLHLPLCRAAPSLMRSVSKTVPLIALAAFAAGTLPFALVVALILSAIGDLALSRAGERAFLIGLGAFALAHLAFIVAFVGQGAFVLHVPVLLALLALAASAEWWLIPFTDEMRWPVRIYILLICVMVLAALPVSPLVALGATLFMASDLVLALRTFRIRTGVPLADYAVWLLYIAAQMLIVFAFLALRN